MFPFSQVEVPDGLIRTFSGETNEEELIWHRDKEDREVSVLQSDGWYFQLDEELPVLMRPGDVFRIPKETWHRVTRRSNDALIVRIKKL